MTSDASSAASTTLAAALARHAITLEPQQVALLERYCQLLWEWNEKINLTRHTDYDTFVVRDVVDSLSLVQILDAEENVLDVGSGGGVPGIVLAIVRPDLLVTMAESMAKKARVLQDVVERLALPATVHHGRAEQLLADEYYHSLTVRAVAPLEKLLRWFAPHWGAIGRLLVIKGPAWVEERREAREKNLFHDLQLRKLAEWPLPGTHSQSVLLEIRPK